MEAIHPCSLEAEMDSLFVANEAEVLTAMENERQKVVSALSTLRDGYIAYIYQFDPVNRALSEMALCTSLRGLKMFPPNVALSQRGRVIYQGNEKSHTFLVSTGAEERIFDITSGQFIESDNDDLPPGERIRILKEQAPGLVKIYPRGLAVLSGTPTQIKGELGIDYFQQA